MLASLKETFPGIDWEKQAAYFFQRVIEHGRRRSEEVREVAVTVREAGLDTMVARAAPPSARPGSPTWPMPVCSAAAAMPGFARSADWRTEADRSWQRSAATGRSADDQAPQIRRWRSSAAARPACCCRSCCAGRASKASCSSGSSRALRRCRASAPACSRAPPSTCCAPTAWRSGWTAKATRTTACASSGPAATRSSSTRSSFLGRRFMTYGQTQIQEDLYAAADRRGQPLFDEVQDVALHGPDSRARHTSRSRATASRAHRLRIRHRLRRLPRRVAPRDPAHGAARVREGLPVRLARRHGATSSR